MTAEEELEAILDLLAEYEGESLHEKVQAAMSEVEWLKDELMVAQQQLHATRIGAKQLLAQVARAREVMEVNDPANARDIFGRAQGESDEQARQTETKA